MIKYLGISHASLYKTDGFNNPKFKNILWRYFLTSNISNYTEYATFKSPAVVITAVPC